MIPEYWQKQVVDTPLYPDILWSRPENRAAAGKLLIIGGNSHGFAGVGEAYMAATQAGAGTVRALLPNALQKIVGGMLEQCEYAPSTPSGSFAREALGECALQSNWADGVLLAGDFGRNSETAILLESFVTKYSGQLTVTKDAADYFINDPKSIAHRPNTTLVLNLGQLQKFATALHFETPILLSMGMMLLSQALHTFTKRYPITIITKELDTIIVAHGGHMNSTKIVPDTELWATQAAAKSSVFWMQNPARPLEAMTTAFAVSK